MLDINYGPANRMVTQPPVGGFAPTPPVIPIPNAAIRSVAANPMGVFPPTPAAPGGGMLAAIGAQPIASPGGIGSTNGFGFNMDTAQLALGGLQTIGNIWQAWNAQKLAKEQFAFQKNFAEENMANQIKSYNTTLDDKARSRAVVEGQSNQERDDYIKKNSL